MKKGTMTYFLVPEKVDRAYAPLRRIPVKGTLNGCPFQTTICDMGAGMMIGVSAHVRADTGLKAGDVDEIVIEHDTAKRTVSVPDDLRKAMSKDEREKFDRFSFTHQKEFVTAVDGAKKPETRQRRIASVLKIIRAKM